jgi:hypothetical protein
MLFKKLPLQDIICTLLCETQSSADLPVRESEKFQSWPNSPL